MTAHRQKLISLFTAVWLSKSFLFHFRSETSPLGYFRFFRNTIHFKGITRQKTTNGNDDFILTMNLSWNFFVALFRQKWLSLAKSLTFLSLRCSFGHRIVLWLLLFITLIMICEVEIHLIRGRPFNSWGGWGWVILKKNKVSASACWK